MTDQPKKRLGYTIGDPMRTTTDDAVRVWLTTGNTEKDGMSVAVMVRCVSMNHELHDDLVKHLRTLCRGAVMAYFEKVELRKTDTPAGVAAIGQSTPERSEA